EGYAKKAIKELNAEIKKRYKKYTQGKLPQLKNKIVIVVDDGLATGYTMLAAIKYVKSKSPKKVIVTIPVAARDSYEKVKAIADEVVCLHVPIFFSAVGSFYKEFKQLEDKEVKQYVKNHPL
ncbi:MAG: phosphoribosyltransferase family protein, partial [Nanoarchaeota archaeon]